MTKARRNQYIKKGEICIMILLVITLLLLISCNLPFLFSRTSQSNEIEELQAALSGEVVDNRQDVYSLLGRPDAFDIAVVEVEGTPVRTESWRYYQYGAQVDFVDGSAIWVSELEPVPEDTIFAAWYNPLDFVDGITGTQAIEVATAASPARVMPQQIALSDGDDEMAGGYALIGDQIVIGLYEDQVVYIETIAFMPEGGDQ